MQQEEVKYGIEVVILIVYSSQVQRGISLYVERNPVSIMWYVETVRGSATTLEYTTSAIVQPIGRKLVQFHSNSSQCG